MTRYCPHARLHHRLSVVIASCCAVVALLAPLTAISEDIDIYIPHPDLDVNPTMMIGLDSSASMNFTGDAWAKPRADRVKEPIIDFLRTSDGIDVGLATFNGMDRGAAVIAPARDLDEDLCPDDACGEISIRVPIARDADDGYERESNGGVTLLSAGLNLGARIDDGASQGRYLDAGGQSFLQSGTQFLETELLPFSVTESGETASIGLHFPHVTLPSNAKLNSVRIHFEWAGQEWLDADVDEGAGSAKLRIRLDSRKDSPTFADAAGRRITDRPMTSAHVDWEARRPANWERLTDEPLTRSTNNLRDVFLEVFDQGDTGPLTVIIEPAPDATLTPKDSVVFLGNHSRGSAYPAPRLVLGYNLIGYQPVEYVTGYRFDHVKVPPGATITDAYLEVLPRGRSDDTEQAFLQIRGDDSDDSEDLKTASRNFSSRDSTTAQVNWSPDRWGGLTVRQRSPDLSAIVQEIVERDGWCAGGAMTMLVEGDGQTERYTWGFRAGAYRAASLHISYDPASVDRSTHCTTLDGSNVQMVRSAADAVQLPDGTTSLDVNSFDQLIPPGGQRPVLGLRFPSVDLDRGDVIADARLLLTSDSKTNGTSAMDVAVDDDPDSGPWITGTPVSDRFAGDPTDRFLTAPMAESSRIESDDLSDLLQAVIDAPGWVRGSTLTLSLALAWGTPASVRTSLALDGDGPQLRLSTRVRDEDAAAAPFKVYRDELIERIQVVPAVGNTPLVNLYEESVRYLAGEPVEHGRRRGEQGVAGSVHRLSQPDTYRDGVVIRPIGCTADDPGNEACAGETISGDPVYLAPQASECRASQVVLVTDGAPTPSLASSAPAIRRMTGQNACASTLPAEECAIELAEWLAQDTVGRTRVTTSTIGFDFSSTFLDELSAAGDGRAYSVSSAGQVGQALRRISAGVVHDSTSFVAPSAAVSQFGRAHHRDDVYLAQFEPAAGKPLWRGNLKRYRLGPLEDGSIGLLDADGDPLMDNEGIDPTARSYWSSSIDGNDVGKGGAASRLSLDRHLLTHPAPSNGLNAGARGLVPFAIETDTILAADLGVTPLQRDVAIEWMRGRDVLDGDGDGLTEEPRRELGAALHTAPQLINYASSSPRGRSVVFSGTQEGYLHAVDTKTGRELFGFLPRELYANVGRFFTDSPGELHHGMGGPITTWMQDSNGNRVVDPGEKAYLTVGMRRGGTHYYTLDVSDPENPSLAWSIDPSREGFEALGQSWSRPVLTTLLDASGQSVTRRDVLIFGNGYRPWNDAPTRPSQGPHGDAGAIFIVDAGTGALLQRIDSSDHSEMVWSIAADVTVADLDHDGLADVLLAVDLGGNVWRVDLGMERDEHGAFVSAAPRVALAARLADRPQQRSEPTGPTTVDGDRRFFHAPDAALLKFPDGAVRLGVAVGSGRRDAPLESETLNRMFLLYLPTEATDADPIDQSDLQDASDAPVNPGSSDAGWWIDLKSPGEKLLGTPLLLDNRVFATTYVPAQGNDDPCQVQPGGGRLYEMGVFTASGLAGDDSSDPSQGGDPRDERYSDLPGQGIPPPVAVFISESDPDAPAVLVGTEAVGGTPRFPARLRTYWTEE